MKEPTTGNADDRQAQAVADAFKPLAQVAAAVMAATEPNELHAYLFRWGNRHCGVLYARNEAEAKRLVVEKFGRIHDRDLDVTRVENDGTPGIAGYEYLGD